LIEDNRNYAKKEAKEGSCDLRARPVAVKNGLGLLLILKHRGRKCGVNTVYQQPTAHGKEDAEISPAPPKGRAAVNTAIAPAAASTAASAAQHPI
jgi:hypothetical protein